MFATRAFRRAFALSASPVRRPGPIQTRRFVSTTSPSRAISLAPLATFLAGCTGAFLYWQGVDRADFALTNLASRDSTPRYAKKREMDMAIAELRAALGDESISVDAEDVESHGYSAWSSTNIDSLPAAVAYPKSTAEVSQIAKVCNKYRVPMIGYSGGSSLEANFSAPFGGLSIDFMHMNRILEVHLDDMDVVVQPSVGWMELNEQLQEHGLFFPIDPGPTAKIGGMVGTGCSGTNAVRYGTMRDWVINVTAVLANGEIIKTRARPRKSSAGYNLTNLLIGAEGTLALITEVTLKLEPTPAETSVAVVTFPTIRDATSTASKVKRAGIPVAAIELLDDVQIAVINKAGSTSRRWKEAPTVFFKFSGTKSGVDEQITLVKEISKSCNGSNFEFAKDKKEQAHLWSARKEVLWSMLALGKEGELVWSTDVAVPLSKVADLAAITKKNIDELGLFAAIVGHIGDGNFHVGILHNPKDPVELAKVRKFVDEMVQDAIQLEGTCTGEHGIGLGKKAHLVEELGASTIQAMQEIKLAWDPKWLMNPGKIIDHPQKI